MTALVSGPPERRSALPVQSPHGPEDRSSCTQGGCTTGWSALGSCTTGPTLTRHCAQSGSGYRRGHHGGYFSLQQSVIPLLHQSYRGVQSKKEGVKHARLVGIGKLNLEKCKEEDNVQATSKQASLASRGKGKSTYKPALPMHQYVAWRFLGCEETQGSKPFFGCTWPTLRCNMDSPPKVDKAGLQRRPKTSRDFGKPAEACPVTSQLSDCGVFSEGSTARARFAILSSG